MVSSRLPWKGHTRTTINDVHFLMKLKAALFGVLFLVFSLFNIPSVFAESGTSSTYTNQEHRNEDLHTYTQRVLIEVTAALSCQISGVDPINPERKCMGIDIQNKRIGYVENNGGAIGFMGNMIAMTFDIPVHSNEYVSHLASNFGITKNSYAQAPRATQNNELYKDGIGYTGLMPLMKLWTVFRNTVYFLFVMLFFLLGLGIMLRFKIDARTVMTIQNTLPRIVVALLLITFSYAIAGFMIDLMYVSMYFIFGLFAKSFNVAQFNPTLLQDQTPFNAVGGLGGIAGLSSRASGSITEIFMSILDGSFGSKIVAIVGMAIGAGAGTAAFPGIGTLIGGALGGFFGHELVSFVARLFAWIFISITLLIALIRIWFILLKSYIYILIHVTLAPFHIALGLLPGSSLNFTNWLKTLLANLSAFPATLGMLLFGKVIMESFSRRADPTRFVPPLIGDPADIKAFGGILGLLILMMIPEVVSITHQFFKAQQGKLGQAAVGNLKAGGPGGIVGSASSLGSSLHGISYIPGLGGIVKKLGGVK